MFRICVLLLVVCSAGCKFNNQNMYSKPTIIQPDKPTVIDPSGSFPAPTYYWQSIATQIELSQIQSSTTLVGVVKRLNVAKRLPDLSKFEAAFPNITKTIRPLTPDDAAKLRGL